ncbi:hypothetical protein B0H10DRAFT_2100499 [Mycena sp. CBHHK59/15]|nr:hypothetical protein B0H10DRAFT_2100499 [Mycena sp. CBHHK59/15]
MSDSNNSASVIIAIVALVGSIVSASLTAYVTLYAARRTTLEQARAVHFKYRNPILLSAHHLQGRFHNIADRGLGGFRESNNDYVVRHTIYLMGRYFAWHAILEKEVQFLAFDRSQDAIRFRDKVSAIRQAFSTSVAYGVLMVWTGVQTTIGEVMTRKEEGGQRTCMTYAEFCDEWDANERFRKWFDQIEADLQMLVTPEGRKYDWRMRRVQNALVDLVELLDPKAERYAETTLRRCRSEIERTVTVK